MILQCLDHIQDLIFSYCNVNDLRNLSLTNSKYNDAVASHLFHTVKLPECILKKKAFFSQGFQSVGIRKLSLVKVLRCSSRPNPISCDVIGSLSQLITNLHELDLSRCVKVNDEAVAAISEGGGMRLKSLDLSNSLVSAIGCSHLLRLTSLEKLSLRMCDGVDDEAIQQVAKITGLKSIDIASCCRMTNASYLYLTNLLHLQEVVTTCCCDVTDDAYLYLSRLPTLKKLVIREGFAPSTFLHSVSPPQNATTNAIFLHVSAFPVLEHLVVYAVAAFDDTALSYVSLLRSLKKLTVISCPHVTDDGIVLLTRLPDLQELSLIRCSRLTELSFQHVDSIRTLKKTEVLLI